MIRDNKSGVGLEESGTEQFQRPQKDDVMVLEWTAAVSFRRLFHSTIKSGIQRQALDKAEEGIAVKACWSPKRPFCAAPGRVNERLQCCNSLARGPKRALDRRGKRVE